MASPKLRFRDYELDPDGFALCRAGHRIRLERKPLELLILLAEKQGQLVGREEIIEKIWGKDFFFDAENGINNAVRKVRSALNDDAEQPRFVETTLGKGYRFIAPVERVLEAGGSPTQAPGVLRARPQRFRWRWAWISPMAVAALFAVAFVFDAAGIRHRIFARAVPPIRSIAVLPLENLSGDPEQEYFADGMTDELIAELAKIRAVRVISRTSVMQYKGAKKPLPQIARELGVEALVEGTVVRSGDRIRVTANLVQALPERHLWADNYERDMRDVLALQRDVAREIANEIRVKVTSQEAARLARTGPVNPRAYEAYLKGRYYLEKWSADGAGRAVEYFQQAIETDPNYALPYAGLAETYLQVGIFDEQSAKARTAVSKALELDDTLGEAHASLGILRFRYDWDFAGAEKEFKRAIELNPNYAAAHHWYSHYLMTMDRFEESLAESKRNLELDPLSPAPNLHLGNHYLTARQYDLAIQQELKTLQMDPNYIEAHRVLGHAYLGKGMNEEAIRELEKAKELSGNATYNLAVLGHAYGVSGRKGDGRRVLGELLERSKQGYVSPPLIAAVYAGLGDKDHALEWLERAYQARSPGLVDLKHEHVIMFDNLRSDPRFRDLLRRVGLSP